MIVDDLLIKAVKWRVDKLKKEAAKIGEEYPDDPEFEEILNDIDKEVSKINNKLSLIKEVSEGKE